MKTKVLTFISAVLLSLGVVTANSAKENCCKEKKECCKEQMSCCK